MTTLVWFAPSYDALGTYRSDSLIPFGLVSRSFTRLQFVVVSPLTALAHRR